MMKYVRCYELQSMWRLRMLAAYFTPTSFHQPRVVYIRQGSPVTDQALGAAERPQSFYYLRHRAIEWRRSEAAVRWAAGTFRACHIRGGASEVRRALYPPRCARGKARTRALIPGAHLMKDLSAMISVRCGHVPSS